MRNTGRLILALAGTVSAAPAMAQSAGTVELGAFGRWTDFGAPLGADVLNRLPNDNGLGVGLRAGVFLATRFEVEADASSTWVHAAGGGTVNYLPIHAGLTYSVPLGSHSTFLLGGRYVHNAYGDVADFGDGGVGAVAGLRVGVLRLEATMDWMPSNTAGHGSYQNLGIDAGVSWLLGTRCGKSADGVTVRPTRVVLDPGGTATFAAAAIRCGKPSDVTWAATGGSITGAGVYTAGATPGSYQVTATESKSGLSGAATVVIQAPAPPPPPPPPPVTMTSIHLTPQHAQTQVHAFVSFTVTGTMSDGTNQMLGSCPLTATGNAVRRGTSFSWDQYGAYTVTANCNGLSDHAMVEVPLVIVVYETNFAFNKDRLTHAGTNSVHAAADSLKMHPDITVRLAGFADFVGSDAYNCALSWRRAETVHRTLNQFGISDDQISAVEGFGHVYPVPTERVPQSWKDLNAQKHDQGKWWDRRVDITSATKDAEMTACAKPVAMKRKR